MTTDQITRLLDQIQRLDQEATKAPWITYGGSDSEYGEYTNICNTFHNGDTLDLDLVAHVYDDKSSAELIALARTAMPALAQTVRAVLELHRPETRWSYEPEPEYSFRTRPGLLDHFGLDGEPYNPSHISQWQICAYCAEVEQGAAEDLGHLTALWPCTTYKTITKALGDDDAD